MAAFDDISDPLDAVRIGSPDFWNFAQSQPELMDILRFDTAYGKPYDAIVQDMHQSGYWQNTSDSARSRDWLVITDPGEAAKTQAQVSENVSNIAERLGYKFADGVEYMQFAAQAAREGWDETKTRTEIMKRWAVREVGGNDLTLYSQMPGEFGNQMTKVLNLGQQYGVPVTAAQAGSLASQIMLGSESEESVTQNLRNWAKGYYAGNEAITKAIDSGQTVMQFADPYIQMAAKELEINPAQIDFTAPKWNVALNGTGKTASDVNPQGGTGPFGVTAPAGASKAQGRAPMSLADWQRQIRTNPEYGFDATTNARTQAAQFSTQLMQEFGATG